MGALAKNAAIRTLLQGIALTAAAAVWASLRAQVTGSDSIPWQHVTWVAVQAAGMAVAAYLLRAVQERHISPADVDVDKWVRAGRTLITGLLATVGTAVYQAIAAAAGSGTLNPATLMQTALVAAGMAALAWLHRLLDDGLPVWTAAPPSNPPFGPA